MLKTRISLIALALVAATQAQANDQAESKGFVEDSTFSINTRLLNFGRDFRNNDTGKSELKIALKYYAGKPVIERIERVSRPGLRIYKGRHDIPSVMNGLGVAIVTTPKGVMTDRGFENAVQAQQMWGGHGYIEENGMSQYVRDARIAMLYEGANGVQAMDLVGRKLGANGGRAVMAVFKEIGDFCEENRAEERLAPFTKAIKKGLNDLQAATMWFMSNAMAAVIHGDSRRLDCIRSVDC